MLQSDYTSSMEERVLDAPVSIMIILPLHLDTMP